MTRVRLHFRWLQRPQLAVGFIVVCLSIGALGSAARSETYASLYKPRKTVPAVKAASTPAVPDCTAVPCLALTFDDGPSERVTPQVLDTLARHQVKATFFVVGRQVPGRESILRRIHQEGHEVGNHSWSHTDFTKLSPADIEMEFRLSQAAIARAGVPAPTVFRPPYGAVNPVVLSHTPLAIIKWNVDPEDWDATAQQVLERVLHQARPGGIVLMHDLDQTTADALEPALLALKPHYQFVTASQLLDLSPGDTGLYLGR
jgi:peptidoglycan-N-acetylglucosamine deacetylase